MGNALASVLETLHTRYPRSSKFQASDIALFAGAAEPSAISFKAALELASGKSLPIISSPAVSWRLKAIKDRPVQVGDQTLVLRFAADKRDGGYFSMSAL